MEKENIKVKERRFLVWVLVFHISIVSKTQVREMERSSTEEKLEDKTVFQRKHKTEMYKLWVSVCPSYKRSNNSDLRKMLGSLSGRGRLREPTLTSPCTGLLRQASKSWNLNTWHGAISRDDERLRLK